MSEETLYADVSKCRRCGRDHKNLRFSPLTNPSDEWRWWALCPEIQQPVLLRLVQDDDKEGNAVVSLELVEGVQ